MPKQKEHIRWDEATPISGIQSLAIDRGERGILLSVGFRARPQPYNVFRIPEKPSLRDLIIKRGPLDDSAVIYGLLFWDKAVLPVQAGFVYNWHSTLSARLSEAGLLKIVGYSVGDIERVVTIGDEMVSCGEQNNYILGAHYHAWESLNSASRGPWTYHASMNGLFGTFARGNREGVLLSLANLLPIPKSIEDVDRFLLWRERRRDERRRFLHSLNLMVSDIENSETPEASLRRHIHVISGVCEDLSRVAKEEGFVIKTGTFDYGFSFARPDVLGLIDTLSFGDSYGFFAGALRGLIASVRIKRARAFSDRDTAMAAPHASFGRVMYSEEN